MGFQWSFIRIAMERYTEMTITGVWKNNSRVGRSRLSGISPGILEDSIHLSSFSSGQRKGGKTLCHPPGSSGAELRLKGIVTMQEANRFLQSIFIKGFNRRFAVRPRESQKAWREISKTVDLDRIISFVMRQPSARIIRFDWRIDSRYSPGPQQKSYAKTKIEARQLLNGSWRIYAKKQLIAKHSPLPSRNPSELFLERETL